VLGCQLVQSIFNSARLGMDWSFDCTQGRSFLSIGKLKRSDRHWAYRSSGRESAATVQSAALSRLVPPRARGPAAYPLTKFCSDGKSKNLKFEISTLKCEVENSGRHGPTPSLASMTRLVSRHRFGARHRPSYCVTYSRIPIETRIACCLLVTT